MKISFIAENDFANVLTEYSYCLNKHSNNIEAKSICFRPHKFNYSLQHNYDLHRCSEEQKLEAKQFLEESDVIIFGEEGHPLEPTYRTLREFSNLLGLDLINSSKKLCIWHPGTHYRTNYDFYNNHPLKNKIHKHLYAMDLYRLSLKQDNDVPLLLYQYKEFDKQILIKNFQNKLKKDKRTILHIPSNPTRKGTDLISPQLKNLPPNWEYNTVNNIPYSKVIELKSNSLFYIDQFNKAGTYGVAAVEAIFNSNLVFCTLHNSIEAMIKLTSEPVLPFIDLGTNPNQINEIISHFTNLSNNELINTYIAISDWLETYYSPKGILSPIIDIIK